MIAHTQDVLMFIDNTAISGDVIYGAYFDFDCYDDGAAQSISNLSKVIMRMSSFSPSLTDGLSLISSDPISVRSCNKDRIPNCFFNDTFSIKVYPGQLFQVLVVTVGDMCGLVGATVLATVERPCKAKLGDEYQYKQTTNSKECSSFQYSIFTSKECVLTLSLIGSVLDTTVQINAHVLGCPEGFTLTGLYCDCHLQLKLTGNITELSTVRQGTIIMDWSIL